MRRGRWTLCQISLRDDSGLRVFNVVDDLSREAVAVGVDFSLPAERVIHALD